MDRSHSKILVKTYSYFLLLFLPLFFGPSAFSKERSLRWEYLSKQIESDPWDVETRLDLAKDEFAVGKLENAWKISDQVYLMEPGHSGVNALRCRILFSQGKWEDLLFEIEKRAMPIEPEFQFFRARALFQLGRDNESFATAKSILKASMGTPFYPSLLGLLGDLAFGGSSGEDFLAYYQKSFELDPENREFQFKLGRAYFKMNRLNQAKGIFEKLEQLGYASDDFRYNYLLLLEQGTSYSRMGSLLSRWNIQSGGKSWILASLIRVELKVGKSVAANSRIEEVLSEHKDSPEIVAFFDGIKNGVVPIQKNETKIAGKKSPKVVKKVRVRKGDSLDKISQRLYGTSRKWQAILELNPKLGKGRRAQFNLRPGMWLNVMTVGQRGVASEVKEESSMEATGELAAAETSSIDPGTAEASELSLTGQENKSVLVSPEEASSLPPFLGEGKEVAIETITSSEQLLVAKEEVKDDRPIGSKYSAHGDYGFYSMEHSLQGQGFTASLKPDSGYKLQGGFSVGILKSSRIEASVSTSEASYEGLTTLSPRVIVVKDSSISAGIGFTPFPELTENLKASVHWCIKKREATNTNPNLPVSAYDANGPCAAVTFTGNIYKKLEGKVGANIFFPYKYAEKSRATGSYQSALQYSLAGSLHYPLYKKINVYSGLQYSVQRATFTGTGSRSVQDAEEKSTALNVPFGVELRF